MKRPAIRSDDYIAAYPNRVVVMCDFSTFFVYKGGHFLGMFDTFNEAINNAQKEAAWLRQRF